MKFNFYTNKDLVKGVNKIARQAVTDNFIPEIVIGIMRGGMAPAIYLSHWFDCQMCSIEWSTRDQAVGQKIDAKIYEYIDQGKNVLIVDDICDSGLTLQQIFSNINQGKLKENVKSAVLHYNVGQDVFDPDYYHLEINKLEDSRWVVYPWEDL